MPEKKIITIKDFKGGLVTARYPQNGEFSLLRDFFLLNGVIRRRYGMTVWPVLDGGAALMSNITGIISLTRANGNWSLVGLNPAGLTKVVFGGTSVALTDAMSLAFATGNNLWRSCQYKNYGYAVRSGLTSIIRFDDTNYWSNGIAAPTTNAVLATGAAGTVLAGNYYGVYTFVDVDGVESNPSPISAIYVAPGAALINWTSVDVSTNPRVTSRRLYRTITSQIGEYFLVATIADNTATTATEGVDVASMGVLAPVDNAVPPTKNWLDIATAYERLWVTDGSYVYGSAAEDPDSFPPENIFAFSPDDGQPIRSVCKHGNALVVLKTGSVWALDQTLGEFEFVPRLIDDRNGCTSTNSVVSTGGRLFWFSGKAIFMSDGRSPGVDISTGRIGSLINLDANYASFGVAAAFPSMGWYVFGIKDTISDILVYDYRRDYWFTITNGKGVKVGATTPLGSVTSLYPVFFTTVLDSNGDAKVYGQLNVNALDPLVFDIFASDPSFGNGDIGGIAGTFFINFAGTQTALIDSTLEFQVDVGAPGLLHSISRILMHSEKPASPGDVLNSLTVFMDPHGLAGFGAAAGSKTRNSITLSSARMWKNIGLSSRERKSSISAIRLSSSAVQDLPIYGLQIHTEVHNWIGAE